MTNGLNGQRVESLQVLSPTSRQRTPDFVVKLADGTTHRVEVRSATSSPRGRSSSEAARNRHRELRNTPISRDQLATALISKTRSTSARPSQLSVPIAGIAPGGNAVFTSPIQPVSTQMADNLLGTLGSRIPRDARSITIDARDPATRQRRELHYERRGETFVRV